MREWSIAQHGTAAAILTGIALKAACCQARPTTTHESVCSNSHASLAGGASWLRRRERHLNAAQHVVASRLNRFSIEEVPITSSTGQGRSKWAGENHIVNICSRCRGLQQLDHAPDKATASLHNVFHMAQLRWHESDGNVQRRRDDWEADAETRNTVEALLSRDGRPYACACNATSSNQVATLG